MRSLLLSAGVTIVLLSGCSSRVSSTLPFANDAQAATARGVRSYSETVLYNFSSPGYGSNYVSPLTPNGRGDYFGTTEAGGTGHGTVYELIPNGKGGWKESTLHVFTGGSDGGTPIFTPVILDKNGYLFGITLLGGLNNDGVAYRMHRSGQTWTEHAIYNFGSASSPGVNPFSFIADSRGNFFGTVNLIQRGAWTEGVFVLSPFSKGWKANLIFVDGIPSATSGGGGLTIDAKENIFGVTSLALKPSEVFELSPSGNGWSSKILYTFPKINLDPEAPPVLDAMGNIYGATVAGGPANAGTIYELTPSTNGPWMHKTLYAFKGGTSDGAAPYASITFDSSGNIYGTTAGGGAHYECSGVYKTGCGTLYKLTASGGRYVSKLLWSFDGTDGALPFARVTLDAGGHIFGTTTEGGLNNNECAYGTGCGNAFEIK